MKTKIVNGVTFKVDEKWEEVRDNLEKRKTPTKKPFWKKLIDLFK